ncbi:hypothetical protein V2J09_021257 [Rumex salicifolius]
MYWTLRSVPVSNTCTNVHLQKLEKLFQQYGEQTLNRDFCQRMARAFSRSAGRTGKPVVKFDEVQMWFQNKQQNYLSKVNPPVTKQGKVNLASDLDACNEREAKRSNQDNKAEQVSKEGDKVPGLSQLEFEAKSSKDGAWYDVDRFFTHRFTSSGEAEVRVRFVGFSPEDDEWVNVKKCVRERSVPFESWECNKVKVGDIMLCLQESEDHAIYYDAHVVEIQRKMHDIRGCRCIFMVRYNHDYTEERVRLRKLCRILVHPTRN